MVESIQELRKLCQKKIQLYNKKGEENTAPPTQEYFYDQFLRLVSIYFTKLFLYTPLTSNQVTILSMLVGITAGIFFAFEHPFYWIIGFLLLQLFHFLDAVDGEIARYRKEATPVGKYFDLLAHSVVIASFYTGITFGVFWGVGNVVVILLGFICVIVSLLNAISNYLKNYLIYEYILFQNGSEVLDKIRSQKRTVVYSLKYAIKRLLGFDGLAFLALFFALLDWLFQPFIINSFGRPLLISWRFIFLLVSALAGVYALLRRMQAVSKLKDNLFS